jgi:hypothetical protein
MPKYLISGHGVTKEGKNVPPGEILELSEKSGAALVAEGMATEVLSETETVKASADETFTGNIQSGSNVGGPELSEEEKQAKALASQYKRDELAAAAQAAGVDFPYDAKKNEIIAAVIAQGKAEALLK